MDVEIGVAANRGRVCQQDIHLPEKTDIPPRVGEIRPGPVNMVEVDRIGVKTGKSRQQQAQNNRETAQAGRMLAKGRQHPTLPKGYPPW